MAGNQLSQLPIEIVVGPAPVLLQLSQVALEVVVRPSAAAAETVQTVMILV